MFKKHTLCFLVIFLLMITSSLAFAQDAVSSKIIDKSKLDSGLIRINYNIKKDTKIKVMINKGNEKYTYNLKNNVTDFPLQLGNGIYNIYILENIQGNRYKVLEKEEITLQFKKENQVYLQSIQLINWNNHMRVVEKAKELTKNARNDEEKVVAIYNYIINNIDYDYKKAKNIELGYIPYIDEIMKKSKGICYDYAALFAGMLRSVGVPTKLVMGYKNDIKSYHAWNQVYLKDIDKWVIIDTTYDAAWKKKKISVPMIKTSDDYSIKKQY